MIKDKAENMDFYLNSLRSFLKENKSLITSFLNTNKKYGLVITDELIEGSNYGNLIEWVDDAYDYITSPAYPKFKEKNQIFEKFKAYIKIIRDVNNKKLNNSLIDASKKHSDADEVGV